MFLGYGANAGRVHPAWRVYRMLATPRLLVGVLLVALLGCRALPERKPAPHVARLEAFCYVCLKPINGDGGVRAFLAHGFERQYRCIHCAMTDLRYTRQPVTVRTYSVVSHTKIEFKLGPGEWIAYPPDPVFLLLPETNGNCREVHQTFVNEAEFHQYLAERPDLADQSPQPLSFVAYEERLKGKEWR